MQYITVVSGETAHPRVMLAALTEGLVRHPISRCDREVTVSMREQGKELLLGAEDTKAELIASNLARTYALEQAMRSPMQIPEEMELSVMAENCWCGRLHLSCPLPETCGTALENSDAVLMVVSPGAPMLAFPYVFRHLQDKPDLGACVALLCDAPPPPGKDAADTLQMIAPAIAGYMTGPNRTVHFYHPCGFAPDGAICSPENASPYGIQTIFWDLVRFTARRRRDLLTQELGNIRQSIRHRNSAFQSGSHRRRLELSQNRAAYVQSVKALYEAQCLLAAEAGTSLPAAAMPLSR